MKSVTLGICVFLFGILLLAVMIYGAEEHIFPNNLYTGFVIGISVVICMFGIMIAFLGRRSRKGKQPAG